MVNTTAPMEIPPETKEKGSGCTEAMIGKSKLKDSRKRGNDYLVWDHFLRLEKGSTGKTERVRCNYCKIQLFYTEEGGTFSMSNHLDECSEYAYNVDKKRKVQEDKDGDSKTSSIIDCNWGFDEKRYRVMIARMIIVDAQPFSLVERDGFREFMISLSPFMQNVSRSTVARDCIRLYLIEKFKLKELLGNLGSHVALSMDMWNSEQNLSYLSLSVHFIDDEWKLHKKILSFVPVLSDNGREVGSLVEKCIQEWGLEGKILTITVGNGSSNDAAVSYLREKGTKLLVSDGDLFHMRCAARHLNSVVEDILDEFKFTDSISRIRSAIRWVRKCPTRTQQFSSLVKKEQIPFQGSVCLDIPARWDTTYFMLDRAYKYSAVFQWLELTDPLYLEELRDEKPTSDDWENVCTLAKFLGKFYESTKRLSGSSHATSNLYFCEMASLLYASYFWANNAGFCSILRTIENDFCRKYGGIDKANMIVLIVVVLDPRYKLKFIKFFYLRIYEIEEEKVDEILTNVKVELGRLFEFYRVQTPTARKLKAHDGSPFRANDSCPYKTLIKHFDNYMKKELDLVKKTELDLYLEKHCEDCIDDFDILTWWKNREAKYKVLSRMARDILAVPASTVTSEAAFNKQGLVLDRFRSSLTPRMAEALVCAQDWLKSGLTTASSASFEGNLEEAEKYESDIAHIDEVELLGE